MEWMLFSFIPEGLIKLIPSEALIIAGYAVEKHYIGRIAFFTNACAINLELYWITELPISITIIFSMYANIGLVFGIYGLIKYAQKEKCDDWFYYLAWAYSSFIVGAITLGFSALLFF